jgi:hypothetical protein
MNADATVARNLLKKVAFFLLKPAPARLLTIRQEITYEVSSKAGCDSGSPDPRRYGGLRPRLAKV